MLVFQNFFFSGLQLEVVKHQIESLLYVQAAFATKASRFYAASSGGRWVRNRRVEVKRMIKVERKAPQKEQ